MNVYPRCDFQLDVPEYGSDKNSIVWHPRVVEVNWTRNHHLVSDELTVSLSYQTSGVDPRLIKSARGALWLWDQGIEDLDRVKHLRFQGIVTKPQRRLSDSGMVVDLTLQDFTSFFLRMKPFPSKGMPSWEETLPQIWQKICDHTGYRDPDDDTKIISNVKPLRDNLVFPAEFTERTAGIFQSQPLGEKVPARFRKITKPKPPGSPSSVSAWDIWQYCVASLGLISYIHGDTCVVTDTTEHYKKADAPFAIWGENIENLEETADTSVSQKGILVKSYGGLGGGILEAVYPKPGDERLKVKRAVAKRAAKEGRTPDLNELSADYIEIERHDIHDQETLDRAARQAYEQMVRQEVEGKFSTAETFLSTPSGVDVPIFDLRAGDPITIAVDRYHQESLKSIPSEEERVRFLIDTCNYAEPVARIIARNVNDDTITQRVFHVKSINVKLGESFETNVEYQNLIVTDD